MSQSLCQIYAHAIFSTKNRVPFIKDDIRAELFGFMAGVLEKLNCPAIEIGGVADHVHVLCKMAKGIAPENLIRELKIPSSQWMKQQGNRFPDFHWQSGYGIFSVSPSTLPKVREYVMRQEEHHRSESFQDEFRRFLARYEMNYDERYVWS